MGAFRLLKPIYSDHKDDHNTSRVCINYAKRWGYGGLIIANLFAYRSTDKSMLYKVADPIGPENDKHIQRLGKEARETVCAWTDDGAFMSRDLAVLPMLKPPKSAVSRVLGFTIGKSAIQIARGYFGRSQNYMGQHF